MRTLMTALFMLGLVALLAPSAGAEGETWHPSLDKGLEAAKKSGKPLLVVTGWAKGI